MRNITDIYQEYSIMPNLVQHQLCVAAVAEMICDHLTLPIDKDAVVTACLLHDMGNIIKFKLDYFPEFIAPGELAYWQGVKEEYLQRYGHDEHRATLQIVEELGLPYEISDIIDAVGFSHAIENREGADFAHKIAAYADMRVSPHGVVSMRQRLEEAHKRYNGENRSTDREHTLDMPTVESFDAALYEIERQIFAICAIAPEDITDEAVQDRINRLRDLAF